ncbi:MAG: hypothetical protein IKF46_07495 [Erysipelotrichaceae bacterium]|nr:hypothetical protein [Erysipelotrichaceae bacterium]
MENNLKIAIKTIKEKYPNYHLFGRVLENDDNYSINIAPDEPDGVNRDNEYSFIGNLPLFQEIKRLVESRNSAA